MQPRSPQSNSGSVILVAVMLAAILMVAAGSLLAIVHHEYRMKVSSHSWSEALQLAEGAVDIGLAELNYQYAAGSNGFQTARNWVNIGAGSYTKAVTGLTDSTGQVLGDLVVTVSGLGGNNPQVLGVGTSTMSQYGPSVSRAVHVVTALGTLRFAMVAADTIKLSTKNNYVDSFDSSTESKSTSHLYDPAKRQANANTASKSSSNKSTQMGGGAVYGIVSTGPDGDVKMPGSVGPLDPAERAYTTADGEAKGYIRHDFTADIPDVTVPAELTGAFSLGIIGSSQTISSGDYKVTSISMGNGDTLTINGTVRLYVTGKIATAGTGVIKISPLSRLIVYVGDAVDFKGSRGLENDSPYAINAQFYGLPTSKTFAIATGGASWIGTIYAPQSALTIGDASVSGSVLADSVQFGSTGSLHYDEALGVGTGYGGGSGIYAGSGGAAVYSVRSWQELKQVDGVWVTQ